MSLFEQYISLFPAQTGHLANACRSGRFGHSFLVVADSESVRREFSLLIAQAGCCQHPVNGAPCGKCKHCTDLERGLYPELHELNPVGKLYLIQVGDRTNPEPNTVRDLEAKFHLTAGSNCPLKVGIIHDADRMNDEAQNALLKTLEEPPPDSLLILNTANPASLLPTTRSRCQKFSLLTNILKYDYPGAEKVFSALSSLCIMKEEPLICAERAAAVLIEAAQGLSSDAEAREKERWSGRFESAAQIDAAFQKRLEKQFESAASGAYMKERRLFLTSLHSFAAQIYMLASGIRRAELPAPEILQGLPEDFIPSREFGELFLKEAEELLFTLRFNVNEELALRTFAINLAVKN